MEKLRAQCGALLSSLACRLRLSASWQAGQVATPRDVVLMKLGKQVLERSTR